MVSAALRHPVTAVAAIALVAGGTGAVLDTVGGPRGQAALDPAAQERLAREAYARLWVRTAPLLGASGMPAPRLRFVGPAEPKPTPGAAMWVGPDETGARTVFITPGQRRLLAKRGGNWRSHFAGLTRTLHETAHYFQSDAVLYDTVGREYGASRWAKAHGPALLGTRRRGRAAAFDAWRDRDQFGPNFGTDPTTLYWPGLGPREPGDRPLTAPRASGPAS